MTALLQTRPAPTLPSPSRYRGEPVALLQLDVGDAREAASAVYREVRRGRGVVAVASGGVEASVRLAAALERIGVASSAPAPGEALIHDGVAIVAGPDAVATHRRPTPARALRVALAGCGVVGGGVLQRLLNDVRFEVVGVLVRDRDKPRDPPIPPDLALCDPAALLAREPDVLIEAVSDPSTALAMIRAALGRGISVVSASKQALANDLAALHAQARATNSALLYSAAVGGSAPLIEVVRRARSHGKVDRIEAVLNGTCNFILNRLSEGVAFDSALAAARSAGFAEEDPSADLNGLDAAAKLAILAFEAGGPTLQPAAVSRHALSPEASIRPGRLRQIARLDLSTGAASIRIEDASADVLFADLPDAANALRVVTTDGRTFTARGLGAGRTPTSESVWADLIDVAT